MIVSLAAPLQIPHGRAVHEYEQLPSGARQSGSQRFPLELERLPRGAHFHLDGEWATGRIEIVSEHAVQRRQHGLTLGARRARADHRRELRERRVDGGAYQARHAAHLAVEERRDGADWAAERPTEQSRSAAQWCCASPRRGRLRHESPRSRDGWRRADHRRGFVASWSWLSIRSATERTLA